MAMDTEANVFIVHFSMNVLISHQFGIVDFLRRLACGVTNLGVFDWKDFQFYFKQQKTEKTCKHMPRQASQ